MYVNDNDNRVLFLFHVTLAYYLFQDVCCNRQYIFLIRVFRLMCFFYPLVNTLCVVYGPDLLSRLNFVGRTNGRENIFCIEQILFVETKSAHRKTANSG